MRQSIILLMLTACALGPSSGFAQGKQYAVLVGVENYEHANLRTPPLKYAVEDVTEFAAVLRKAGYDVILMTDDSGKHDIALLPTQENIDKKMSVALNKCRKSDTVVLAFAGHGLQFEGTKDAYFCPQDAKPFAHKTETLISMKKVYGELESSFAGVKLIFVDACRNDPDPGRGRSGLDADSAPPPKGVGALFSCSAGQKAFEHDDLKHGVFFHYVLQGLQGEAQDKQGRVTFPGLSTYVQDNVPNKVSELFANREQSPNLRADLTGAPPVVLLKKSAVDQSGADTMVGKTPGEVRDLAPGIKFQWCPSGEFLMGSPKSDEDADPSERPQVEITLQTGFWLGKYEVTQAEWKSVMGTEPWKGKEYVMEGPNYPATGINWDDAVTFCQKLTTLERGAGRLPPGWAYGLPSEAQWEYACRAGTPTRYCFGDDTKLLSVYGWYDGLSAGAKKSEQHASQVGVKKANPWGLCDMHGNVWEWCLDDFNKSHGNAVAKGKTLRSTRGGCWFDGAESCRSAARAGDLETDRSAGLGFRLACKPTR